MDLPLDAANPRRKGKIEEALQSMVNLNNSMEPLELPTDPDAQATVTDFLDFTEYLPADMMRSLTLIGNLDQTYTKASASLDELTRTYGKLPDLPLDDKPDPLNLRADISQTLGGALRSRTLSYYEASRMTENVDRHYTRAKTILAKLQAMAEVYPPSREASPAQQKSKSPVASRAPKITLRLDGARSGGTDGAIRVRKPRMPRITVPGEVMAPYEVEYETDDSGSDGWDSEDEIVTSRQTPARSFSTNAGRIKLKIQKLPKSKVPKPPRQPRPPGVMGTNVHSSVAGISTSNALAKLQPPPPDAVIGSADLPWLQLTPWELGTLRKRMKKNAVWSPSDTMIARELKERNRGIEAYRAAKAKAEATGVPMIGETPPQLLGQTVSAEGAISVEAVRMDQVSAPVNKGMRLNEAKKLKREIQQKELAKAAAANDPMSESIGSINQKFKGLPTLFSKSQDDKNAEKKIEKKTVEKSPSKPTARKRKRESNADILIIDKVADGDSVTVKPEKSERPQLKRSKTETPIPPPHTLASKETKQTTPSSSLETPAVESAQSTTSESAALPQSEHITKDVAESSPKTASTPILPPGKKGKKESKKEGKKEGENIEKPINTRPRRSSVAAKDPSSTSDDLPLKRPGSSRSKAASLEPTFPTATATIDRPRRTSTARNTPAPEPRQTNKRAKRPAPGVVTAGSEGSTAVSVGKRRAATHKKAGAKKEKKDGREGSAAQEVYEEYDDEGKLIDPEEPRYCLCNRVSFGTMIGCENGKVCVSPTSVDFCVANPSEKCETEWFHLECVGLQEVPPRTTKWYCPDCRKKLKIGEKGEVNARGKKK